MPHIKPVTDLRNTTEISELCHVEREMIAVDEYASNLIDELEKAIFSLEQLPERGVVRYVGAYANGGYRQLFVKNYVVIYRVLKEKREVHIVTVHYTLSSF